MNIKNKISIILLAVVCSVSFLSCKNDKDKIDADFTYNLLEHGGIEVLPNSGEGFHTWSFGGEGREYGSNGDNKKFYFKENGTYTVKLNVDNIKKSKETTQQVTITGVPSKLKITYAKLLDFNDLDPFGDPWDNDATGPDVIFVYKINNIVNYTSTVTPNILHSQLPITNAPVSTIEVSDLANSYFNVYCKDDNSSSPFAVQGASMTLLNYLPACTTCGSEIYPTKFYGQSENKFEVGLEWLP